MKDKGFFDALFIIIMMLLFLPTITPPSTEIINDNLTHIDEVSFIFDEVVVDALGKGFYEVFIDEYEGVDIDETHCNLDIYDSITNDYKNEYNTNLNSYFNNFNNFLSSYTDINCIYENFDLAVSESPELAQLNKSGNTLTYSADNGKITCDVKKNKIYSKISKNLSLTKNITLDLYEEADEEEGTYDYICYLEIKDASGNMQLKKILFESDTIFETLSEVRFNLEGSLSYRDIINLSHEEEDVSISYTTNGSDPYFFDAVLEPIDIRISEIPKDDFTEINPGNFGFTIKARAYKDGYESSQIKSVSYTFNDEYICLSDSEFITPQQIYCLDELNNIRDYPTREYELMRTLDFNDEKHYRDYSFYDRSRGWEPIVNFRGYFEGSNFSINSLYINRPGEDNIGLFGSTGASSKINNLTLGSVEIDGQTNVGSLVGNNKGLIKNCQSIGLINANDIVGGVVGYNEGLIDYSRYIGFVSGVQNVGGLVGYNLNEINKSFALSRDFSGEEPNIIATSINVGGLVGNNEGNISQSFSNNIVIGSATAGGLIGQNESGTIINSYSLSKVTANNRVGGLIGHTNRGSVENSYSVGLVSGDDGGGLIGLNTDTSVRHSFWNAETSGHETSDGGTRNSTERMILRNTFTSEGWNFTNIWNINENITYPYLRDIEYGIRNPLPRP